MFLTTLIIIVAVSGALVLILSSMNKEKTGWLQFYAKGKEAGFSFREIDLLRQLAVKSNLEEPASIFTSQNQLDMCIRSQVRSMHLRGGTKDRATHDFLSKMYDFRKKIEMEKPRIKHGISNSRQISDGQNLRVLVPGSGVFKSQIIKNTNGYLTVSRPTSSKFSGTFSWLGLKISVYFWREDDAGYVFDTEVQDEVFSKGISSLKIGHSDSLFRTQKRKSIRVKMHKNAFLYLLLSDEEASKIELYPGAKCFLEDLSDTGCAVTIGGKAQTDLRIKVQFPLNNNAIVMSGTVRALEYKEDLNRSLLHIEADPLPIEIRNIILGEVFGMLPEEEEDLPFRILAEEAGEISAGLDQEKNGKYPEFSGKDNSDSMGTEF